MYNTTKKIVIAFLILSFGINSTFANTQEPFAMQEVKVMDVNTVQITFNKDLLEDTSMFEFLLTSKKDDTKEIVFNELTLSTPSQFTAKTADMLVAGEEYNLIVVFASDKDGNVIENGVDGMITFRADIVEAEPMTSGEVNAVPETNSTPVLEDLNAAPVAETPVDVAFSPETAVTTAEVLPQTGPKEVMIFILAMILGLGIMYVRKRA